MNLTQAFAMTTPAPVLTPELQAKADQAYAETMALAEALCRSTLMPGSNTIH